QGPLQQIGAGDTAAGQRRVLDVGQAVPRTHIPVPDAIERLRGFVGGTARGVLHTRRDGRLRLLAGAEIQHGAGHQARLYRQRQDGRRDRLTIAARILGHEQYFRGVGTRTGPAGRSVAGDIETPDVALRVPGIQVICDVVAIQVNLRNVADAARRV